MAAAEDILRELEDIGAVGAKLLATPPVPPFEEVEEEAPVSAPEATKSVGSRQGALMVQLCRRAVEVLSTSIEAQVELRDVLIEMHNLWAEDGAGPGEEEAPDTEEEEELDEDGEAEEGPDAASTQPLEAPAAAPVSVEDPFELSVPPAVSPEGYLPVHEEAEPEPEAPELGSGPRPVPPLEALSPRRRRFVEKMRAEAQKEPNVPR